MKRRQAHTSQELQGAGCQHTMGRTLQAKLMHVGVEVRVEFIEP